VRANVELARLRNHHARWRAALVDSLQEAFFVCDEHGAVIEINTAFTDILGYGTDGLPYEPIHPWWPDGDTDPEAHRQVGEAFAALLTEPQGAYTIPVTHRDGHRLWITAGVNQAHDPDTGRRVTVGSFRDVTAEHHTAQRQTALAALNQLLAQADTVDDALHAAAEELRRLWQAQRVLAVTFAGTDGTPGPKTPESPQVLSAGEPAQWPDLPADARRIIGRLRDGDQLVTDTTRPASAGIALQHPQGVLVVWIELAEKRPFTDEDQTTLTVLAGRLGQGLQRVQLLDQQRETALALQHAILGPNLLPAGFAARYEPANRPMQVGGDWYDVVDLDDGRIGLIVGDCVGHGLAAATVMGQLRSACRALLLENPSPREALAALDRFAARLTGAECTSAFCAVLSPETGELTYSSAGHPPPILVYADGSHRLLEDSRDIPVGLRTDRSRPEAQLVVPPRATLLLYTDGLVERRREPLDRGIARAVDVLVKESDAGLDDLASQIMSQLAPDGGYQDDVALLFYRQPAPLHMSISADARHLASTRTALRSWFTQAGVNPEQSLDLLIASGEALANAIEHGYRHHPDGTVRLTATALVDGVEITITDAGSWKTPLPAANPQRGRGITMMRAFTHDVTIDHDVTGTRVCMYARIT
jgi:PAS domain S-box-containing protein